jgi:hypothetical protein
VHEQSLDRFIEEKFKLKKTKTGDGKKRFDFFCLGDKYKVAHVVELKRPQDTVGKKEMDQLRDYVLFLRDKLQDSSTDEKYRRVEIKGLLVCSKIRQGDEQHRKNHQASGVMDIRLWDNLLTISEQLHAEFLEVVKSRAPQDDPRVTELASLEASTKAGKQKGPKKAKKKGVKRK